MKYLIAPSSYKGYFKPSQLALSIQEGLRKRDPDCETVMAPIADGGDGSIESIHVAVGGELNELTVEGPVGDPVSAVWLVVDRKIDRFDIESAAVLQELRPQKELSPQLAIVELASACGIAYLQDGGLAALDANTIGAGQVLKHCRDLGHTNIVLTAGGSASTDGGMGILVALGAKFFDKDGKQLPAGGRYLSEIVSVDLSSLKNFKTNCRLRVATDVVNELLGEEGAARIFAPQKGASHEDVQLLERGLENFANVMENETGQLARGLIGAGAAGGVPFGLAIGLDAQIIPGFRWIAGLIGLEEKIRNADVVISAEGKLDSQSVSGKAIGELASLCSSNGKKLWVLPAKVETGIDWSEHGIDRVLSTANKTGIATLQDVALAASEL